MICSKCGKQIPDGIRFCPNCGNPVASAEDAKTQETSAQQTQNSAQQTYQTYNGQQTQSGAQNAQGGAQQTYQYQPYGGAQQTYQTQGGAQKAQSGAQQTYQTYGGAQQTQGGAQQTYQTYGGTQQAQGAGNANSKQGGYARFQYRPYGQTQYSAGSTNHWMWMFPTGIGAILGIIGSFVPWMKMEFLGMSETVSGLTGVEGEGGGDGFITLFVCIAVIALAVVAILKRSDTKGFSIANLCLGVVALIVSIYDLSQAFSVIDGYGVVTMGPGLWMILIGAILIIVASVLLLLKKDFPMKK